MAPAITAQLGLKSEPQPPIASPIHQQQVSAVVSNLWLRGHMCLHRWFHWWRITPPLHKQRAESLGSIPNGTELLLTQELFVLLFFASVAHTEEQHMFL